MWAWLVSLVAPLFEKIFIDLIGSFVGWLTSLWTRHEKEIDQDKQAEADRAVINNPASTPEERKDAQGNVLNS